MNTSMFLPQVAETDVYDANGKQVDDINSVVEYFAVVLGFDHTADDEDDDNGQNFHLIKTSDCNFQQSLSGSQNNTLNQRIKADFSNFQSSKVERISYEIVTPPPDI